MAGKPETKAFHTDPGYTGIQPHSDIGAEEEEELGEN